MEIHIDNQAAIKQIENEATSSSMKHVDVKMKFVRDTSAQGAVKSTYVETKEMLADILTKSMPNPRILELRGKTGFSEG